MTVEVVDQAGYVAILPEKLNVTEQAAFVAIFAGTRVSITDQAAYVALFSTAPPAGSPGGGGTVAKAPDPIRPNRRAQVRGTLEDQLDKAQRVDEPVIEAPKPVKKPKRVAPIAPTLTATPTLGIIRDIEARVQAAIDAEATAQALAQAEALAMELAWIAEDEADLELLLLSM